MMHIYDQNLQDRTLMRLHFYYTQWQGDPLANQFLCGINIPRRISELEYEIHQRTSILHLRNINQLLTINNITAAI
jgi:hypothetical protein